MIKCPHCKKEVKITKKQAAVLLSQGHVKTDKQKEASRRNVAQMNWDMWSKKWTEERKQEFLNKFPNVKV